MVTYLFSTYFWPTVHPLFVQRVRKKNILLETRYSWRCDHDLENTHVRRVLRKFHLMLRASVKLFLVIDILHLEHCFKICFNYVLPVPMESRVNGSNKHVFVRRNCMEFWGNLRRWYLVSGLGDLFFLFYTSKHCTIDNNLWKFDKNLMLNFISGEWP